MYAINIARIRCYNPCCKYSNTEFNPSKMLNITLFKFRLKRLWVSVTCVKRLCGTGQPAAPGQVLFWAETSRAVNTQRCHLCHLTLTGGLLVPVCLLDTIKWRQLGDGAWGRGTVTKWQVIWQCSVKIIPQTGSFVLLVVFDTIVVGCHPKVTNIGVMQVLQGYIVTLWREVIKRQ